MKDGKPTVCVPDPLLGTCAKPYHDSTLDQEGGPHAQDHSVIDVNGGRMDGFIRATYYLPTGACAASRFAPIAATMLDPSTSLTSWVRTTTRDCELLVLRENFVLQDRMFGPTDSWTVPAHLFLVSGWSARCQSPWDPMSCVSDVDLDGVAESQRLTQRGRSMPGPTSPTSWRSTTSAGLGTSIRRRA